MGDRPGSSSRVRTSEDKVCRKDLCWFVRAVYVLNKLSDVSRPGLGEAGRYISPASTGGAAGVPGSSAGPAGLHSSPVGASCAPAAPPALAGGRSIQLVIALFATTSTSTVAEQSRDP